MSSPRHLFVVLLILAAFHGPSAAAARPKSEALARDLRSAKLETQRNAAAEVLLLAQFGQLSAEDIDRVYPAEVEALANAPAEIRAMAAITLGLLRDRRATTPLLAATRDTDQLVRTKAISALGHLRDGRAIPRLQELRASGTELDRRAASRALDEITTGRSPAPPRQITPDQLQQIFEGMVEVKPSPETTQRLDALTPDWQQSWPAFVRAFAGEAGVPDGDPDPVLIRRFSGKRVSWEGSIGRTFSMQRIGESLWIGVPDMTPHEVRVRSATGRLPILLHVSPRSSELDQWKRLRPGARVRFEGTLQGFLGHPFYLVLGSAPKREVNVMIADVVLVPAEDATRPR